VSDESSRREPSKPANAFDALYSLDAFHSFNTLDAFDPFNTFEIAHVSSPIDR
jgi:hypothetical protein